MHLEELERATKSFPDDIKLGSEGFGTVNKGTLDNGVEVAIKRINREGMIQGTDESDVFRVHTDFCVVICESSCFNKDCLQTSDQHGHIFGAIPVSCW
jgi:hypothetical protein